MSDTKANPNMIEVMCLQDRRLATTKGHIIQFEARKPTLIPKSILAEAMAIGCAPVDAADQPFVDDLSRARVEFQGDVKRSMVFLAVKLLAERNNPDHFDAGGNPKTKAVSDLLGFEVARQEVIDLYKAFQETKSGNDFALHPASENILRVLNADSKPELLELAEEFGLDKKVVNGKTARDLRKHLLVMLDGAAAGA